MKMDSPKEIVDDENTKGSVEKLIRHISKHETSVRTTFALTKEGEAALTWIRKHSKKSIKSVIDSFCEQLQQALTDDEEESFVGKVIIELAKENPRPADDKTRRSVVLSKGSLKILNDIEKKYQVPRDGLLDRGFYLVKKLMENSAEKRLENHKKALSKVNKLWGEAENIEREFAKFLDEDDPVLYGLGIAITHLMNLSIALEQEQKDGTPVDPDTI